MQKLLEHIFNVRAQYSLYWAKQREYKKNGKRFPVRYWIALKYWAFRRWFITVRNIVLLTHIHDIGMNQLNEQLNFLITNSNRAMKRKWGRLATESEAKNEIPS